MKTKVACFEFYFKHSKDAPTYIINEGVCNSPFGNYLLVEFKKNIFNGVWAGTRVKPYV